MTYNTINNNKDLVNSAPTVVTAPAGQGVIWASFTDGKRHSVNGAKFVDGNYGVQIVNGTDGLDLNGLNLTDQSEYGIYSGAGNGAKPNNGVRLTNSTITMQKQGEHCIRIYNATNWYFENYKLTHNAPYTGATLNVKQISGMYGKGLSSSGQPWGFGPNFAEPKEDGYWVENVELDGGGELLDFNTQIVFWANVRNVVIRNYTINVKKNEVFSFKSVKNRRDPFNIVFENLKITGTGALASGVVSAGRYLSCSYNGGTI